MAAFEVFGDEEGLYARIEDVAEKAGARAQPSIITFTRMAELRDALTYQVTHDLFLRRACTDPRCAWSMSNLSASGLIFGAETFRQVREGVGEGVFALPSVALGRDLLLGTTLAAMASIVRGCMPQDYPDADSVF